MGGEKANTFKLGTRGREDVECGRTGDDFNFFIGGKPATVDKLLEYDKAHEITWDRPGLPARLKQLKAKHVAPHPKAKTWWQRRKEWLGTGVAGVRESGVGRVVGASLLVLFAFTIIVVGAVLVMNLGSWVDGGFNAGSAGPVETTETVTITRDTGESTGSVPATTLAAQEHSYSREEKVSKADGGRETDGLNTTATIVTMVGALLAVLGSIVADTVKNSSDNKKEIEQKKVEQAEDSERNLAKLEILSQAVDLLCEEGGEGEASSLQVEGVLLALARYDIELALDLMGRLPWVYPSSDECGKRAETLSITWEVAARLIDMAFDSKDKGAENVAAWLLCKHYDQISAFDDGCQMEESVGEARFLATTTRIWPIPGPGWRVDLASNTAGVLIKAASKWFAHELRMAPDTIPQPALVLFEALKDPRPMISDIAAHSLAPLLYSPKCADATSQGVWSLNPLVKGDDPVLVADSAKVEGSTKIDAAKSHDPLHENYDGSCSAVYLVTMDEMRLRVTSVFGADLANRKDPPTRAPLSERALRLRIAVERALDSCEEPRFKLTAGPPVALPSVADGGLPRRKPSSPACRVLAKARRRVAWRKRKPRG